MGLLRQVIFSFQCDRSTDAARPAATFVTGLSSTESGAGAAH